MSETCKRCGIYHPATDYCPVQAAGEPVAPLPDEVLSWLARRSPDSRIPVTNEDVQNMALEILACRRPSAGEEP